MRWIRRRHHGLEPAQKAAKGARTTTSSEARGRRRAPPSPMPLLSLAIAAMVAYFAFFTMARGQVSARFRPALVMSSLVVGIAGYHYFRIFESWGHAFSLQNGAYVPTGQPFSDGYRYVDWLLTVPLLVAELVAVLQLPKALRGSITTRLIVATVLMLVTGYVGEVSADMGTRNIWGIVSSVPFAYILYVLFVELKRAAERESGEVKHKLLMTQLLLLGTWGFYPITYGLPVWFGAEFLGATGVVAIQVGYSLADITAKCGYGLMIYSIACAKMDAEGETATGAVVPAAAE
jgi:bacteriorhodopsin